MSSCPPWSLTAGILGAAIALCTPGGGGALSAEAGEQNYETNATIFVAHRSDIILDSESAAPHPFCVFSSLGSYTVRLPRTGYDSDGFLRLENGRGDVVEFAAAWRDANAGGAAHALQTVESLKFKSGDWLGRRCSPFAFNALLEVSVHSTGTVSFPEGFNSVLTLIFGPP